MRTERTTEETNAAKEERLQARRKRDWELMARVAVGDSEAFGDIWHHYRRWLSFHLYQKGILDADQANDILQEVCLKILRFAHKYDRQIATVGTWFALITDNVVYQHRLKYRRLSNYRFISVDEKYELTSEDQFEGPVSREECKSLIAAALERLAPMLRTAIEMKYFQGLDVDAIAAHQNVPDYTVRGRLERGVKELRWHYRAELQRLGAGVVETRPMVPRLITKYFEDMN
jgi:RNA polymerase sigma-70 factor (ECF subfamily)